MVLRILSALILAALLAMLPTVRAADVGIVLSDKGGAYAEFAAAFQEFARGSNWRVRWTGGSEALDTAPRTDLLITVGFEATRTVLRRGGSTPVLATLLPRQAYERALAEAGSPRPKGSVTAIFLDQPLPRLLALTRQLLPERRRIGVLVGPEGRALLPQLRQAIGAANLILEAEEIEGDANLVPAANHLLPRSDVLLALPDSAIYRRDNVRTILLTSYRFRRPVIAFSQALATAGALAAIYSTPEQIARQAQELLKFSSVDPVSLPAPQAPSLFAIAINYNVAQAFGLSLPDEAAVHRALMTDKEVR